MESAPQPFTKTRNKLAAAAISGSIIVGQAVLGGQALAASYHPPAPEFASLIGHTHMRDIGQLIARHYQHEEAKARRHQLLAAKHERIVTASAVENRTLYAEWTKVAVCEEGGWVGSSGSAFPNSLGITSANWYANGGGSDVSPAAQIKVAERMIHSLGISTPDQNGCQAGGW